MNVSRKLKTLTAAAAAGGAAAYFFDPTTGRTRRNRLARRMTKAVEDARHARSKVDEVRQVVVDQSDGTEISDPVSIRRLAPEAAPRAVAVG